MKYKVILFSFLLGLLLWACDDSVSNIGMGILPDQDKIGIYTDTIYLDASTVRLDSIYAKTVYGMLGEFYDPTYGNLKSSFLCQFYAPQTETFRDSVLDSKMDSIVLNILYRSYLGDSLAPMQVSVYPVTQPLGGHYYTNISPSDYCDMNTVLGRQGYTARNLNVTDSANIANGYVKKLSIRLPDFLAQKFYEESLKPSPNIYSSLDDFVKFFPGVYVAPSYGTGNIIYVKDTYIGIYYNRRLTTSSSTGTDSIYIKADSTTFNVTQEIIQLNSYQSSHDEKLLQPSEDKTYVKTPAGIFTKITVPIPDIINKMGAKKFTNAKFSLSLFAKDEWEYAIGYPPKVLLINTDSVTTFFENKMIADNKTSYTSSYTSSYTYDFGNISAVIQNAIENAPDKNLELLVIPVSTQTSGTTDYTTSHFLYPSGATFKKDKEHLRLAIVATDMDVNQLKSQSIAK
ncbi:MAG: DUF4270 domain-containing protein [Dysgonamonadaceae bacterium]|jgi:hypothetical protein|nr:DUF4270 domain-containing protein [Dysgonamonadaceae bacterium]